MNELITYFILLTYCHYSTLNKLPTDTVCAVFELHHGFWGVLFFGDRGWEGTVHVHAQTWMCPPTFRNISTFQSPSRMFSLGQQRNRKMIHCCNVFFLFCSPQRKIKSEQAMVCVTLLNRPDLGCIPWQLWTCPQRQMLVLRKTEEDNFSNSFSKHPMLTAQ